jgi:hypothetical protein
MPFVVVRVHPCCALVALLSEAPVRAGCMACLRLGLLLVVVPIRSAFKMSVCLEQPTRMTHSRTTAVGMRVSRI